MSNRAWPELYEDVHGLMLDAHRRADKQAMVQLNTQAADLAQAHDDNDAAKFFLTQAYIFALDIGCDSHEQLQERLEKLSP